MKKRSPKPKKDKQRLAVIGFGRLGRACAKLIMADKKLELAGIVRRPDRLGEKLPPPFAGVSAVAHISELRAVDAAVICVPTLQVLAVASDLLQHRIPIVECATLHEAAFQRHKQELDRLAFHHETSAIVGAGWDPGVLSLFRGLFSILIPKGLTETSHHPVADLHHSTVARTIAGVKKALSTELPAARGRRQRYLYVELEAGAVFEEVEKAIVADPLFLDAETIVFPVENIAELEKDGHGILVERHEDPACGHQVFLLEARFSETVLAARMMIAAARALPTRHHRAYSLFDLPQRVLWERMAEVAEQEWF
ncbi:diaminopimelate dehydrogenase [Syntrophotalea acetylenivorans]|uniref:Diaminopimelate dehydrogenase n=1 Tax=Syntrophotalea acetylenivorans TaxID=1842532 RepID=A0A1L3GNH8_9BACT|nr:diaminopimelate dehydrogenase [Syntrophotalea acetylenivorans]APG27506.1 diaminopimelate dehydrogenase [Syntrophotalea acetylenivorans]